MGRRADGRFETLVHVPADMAADIQRRAAEANLDVGTWLGDAIAEVLPDALADAARQRLAKGHEALDRYMTTELDRLVGEVSR